MIKRKHARKIALKNATRKKIAKKLVKNNRLFDKGIGDIVAISPVFYFEK